MFLRRTFVALFLKLTRKPVALFWVFCAALLFAVQSNLLHGWRYGIDYPTATSGDSGIEYYHDAIVIHGPLWFLSRFNAIQFELLEHARTHPPGLESCFITVCIARFAKSRLDFRSPPTATSLGLSLPYWRRLLRLTLGEAPTSALLLYAILPANLIYELAVVDAPIAALFLATVVSFVDDDRRASWPMAAAWLSVSLFFTFGALFLLPVLLGYELVQHKRVTRTVLVVVAACSGACEPRSRFFGCGWLSFFLRARYAENACEGLPAVRGAEALPLVSPGCGRRDPLFFQPFHGLVADARSAGAEARVASWLYARLAWAAQPCAGAAVWRDENRRSGAHLPVHLTLLALACSCGLATVA